MIRLIALGAAFLVVAGALWLLGSEIVAGERVYRVSERLIVDLDGLRIYWENGAVRVMEATE